MKSSKKKIIKLLENFVKNYFGINVYSYILFIRFLNKFKRSMRRKKSAIKHSKNLDEINNYEYKITSQNNEDGIIEYLFSKIPNNKFFIEIGFEFSEFNTLNLIRKGWNGVLIDQNKLENLLTKRLINFYFPNSKINIITSNINRDNINKIVQESLELTEIDFFSLDIDGNDYWVLKNMNIENIKCICIEYNHWLGSKSKKTIPYTENFNFKNDGYFGASLAAFNDLLKTRNFSLVAIDSSGTNAFFVNNKFAHLFEVLDPELSFKSSPYLYSEDKKNEIYKKINNYHFEDV